MAIPQYVKPTLLVTRKLPASVEDRISASFDAYLNNEDRILQGSEIVARSNGCDALLVTPTEKCTSELIGSLAETVRIIATFSVGFDHIDVDAATRRGIAVTNTPDVLTEATADIALLLLLGAARGAYWGERMVRENRWSAWSPTHPLGHDFSGRRLGILGMGRIGLAVARRAQAFNMEIHYHGRRRLDPGKEAGARFHERLEAFLPHCDFLSIHCASTPQTRGMLNTGTIALLPEGAIVVNTARGDIVDDDALITALQSGRLAAAGLDVFRNEPDIDPRYRTLENAFLLPHLGSATAGTRIAMGMRALDNLDDFFAGRPPKDWLNPPDG